MLPHEWFVLGLRIIGVIVVLHGSAYLLDSLLLRLRYSFQPDIHIGYYLIFGLAYVVVGSYLLFGGRPLVTLLYPETVEEDENGEDVDGIQTSDKD